MNNGQPRQAAAPAPPGMETVFEVNDQGWKQLQGSSTVLPGAALSLLVLINGRLSLEQIASHLKGLPADKLAQLAQFLEQKGYIQAVKSGEPARPEAFDMLDFFSGQSVSLGRAVEADDKDAARRMEEEARSFSAMLKSQGYAVRIARQVGAPAKPADGRAFSVLCVDDTASLSTAVCTFLQLEGFVPRRASNKEEVVAELRRVPSPDLILLDVGLPDISGFDILQRVRSHPSLKRIPVIMVTGMATREDVMRALSAGANGYITKPFEFEALMNSIKAVLGVGMPPAQPAT